MSIKYGVSKVTVVHGAKAASSVPHQVPLPHTPTPNPEADDLLSSTAFQETGNGYSRVSWSSHKSTLKSHIYHENGLLEVNPEGPHPIFELIERAEKEWEEKHARASKTLEEAVKEYERRYNRPPPLGFDKWWDYVEANSIPLPDSYDQIAHDIEPFWGIEPTDLQRTAFLRESYDNEDTYTLGKYSIDEPLNFLNWSLPSNETAGYDMMQGGKWVIEMLEGAGVSRWIPPFRATFSPHDSPTMHTDYELRKKALEHAAAGTTFSMLNPPRAIRHEGWLAGCSPDSPANSLLLSRYDFYKDTPWPPRGSSASSLPRYHRPNSNSPPRFDIDSKKTFIYNHLDTMHPCSHPHLLRQHAQFTRYFHGPVPQTTLTPFFSFSPSTLHHDIISAIPLNWVPEINGVLGQYGTLDEDGNVVEKGEVEGDLEWEEKDDERLHWRGSNTGMYHAPNFLWRLNHRVMMMETVQKGMNEMLNVIGLRTTSDGSTKVVEKGEPVGPGVPIRKGRWAPAMLDVAFSGEPIACGEGVCEELAGMFEWRKGVNTRGQANYKYILDVDGNAWSSRFKRLITTNSLIFKATIYPEWWSERIQPWVHYVPIQVDLSDLWDAFVFFRGDPNGQHGHEDLAKKIGKAGREWSLSHWRREDMVAYNFRLFLEYARVLSTHRHSLSYIHPTASRFAKDPRYAEAAKYRTWEEAREALFGEEGYMRDLEEEGGDGGEVIEMGGYILGKMDTEEAGGYWDDEGDTNIEVEIGLYEHELKRGASEGDAEVDAE